ncbi:MAG: DNA polymerase IV, partial [Puniceicoccaceae bacterium]
RTFQQDIATADGCLQELPALLTELEQDIAKMRVPRPFNKIFVKLKFSNFQQTTREQAGIALMPEAYQTLVTEAFERSPHAVRLLGVGVRFPEKGDESQLELKLD